MFEVVALGELLIDFTPAGHAPSGEKLFQQNPGGAPANVVSCLARFAGARALSVKSAMISLAMI